MEGHDFEKVPRESRGHRMSSCVRCGVEVSVPDEGTWTSLASPSGTTWRERGGEWVPIGTVPVPPCRLVMG
jgi:hypothetical protein